MCEEDKGAQFRCFVFFLATDKISFKWKET